MKMEMMCAGWCALGARAGENFEKCFENFLLPS